MSDIHPKKLLILYILDILQKYTDEEHRQAKKLITKLESLSNIYFKSRSQYIYPLPVDRTDNKQVFYNISILDEAIRKKQKVLFEYAEYHTDKKIHLKKREDGSVREYVVTPYQMAAQEGKYYLICNYDKYDDISNYRVDRIRNIQILEEKGKPFETLKWSGHQPMNLNEYMSVKFPEAFMAAERICRQMEKSLKLPIPDIEIGYLAMHLERMLDTDINE